MSTQADIPEDSYNYYYDTTERRIEGDDHQILITARADEETTN